jgi:hypothetical protein
MCQWPFLEVNTAATATAAAPAASAPTRSAPGAGPSEYQSLMNGKPAGFLATAARQGLSCMPCARMHAGDTIVKPYIMGTEARAGG